MVTAKVTLASKNVMADLTSLTFVPDYADGRNKEWAQYTPNLNLTMGVKNSVGELFEFGEHYTLTFEKSED